MAYSTSLLTLQRMMPVIEKLETLEPISWQLEDHAAAYKLAYKIREALSIAKDNAKFYPRLAAAADHYAIKVDRESKQVRAIKAQRANLEGVRGENYVVTGLQTAGPPLSTAGPQTAETVINLWNASQPSSAPMHFPQASLTTEELNKLYTWAVAHRPRLMLFVADEALTVQHVDPELEPYAYKPEGVIVETWKPFKPELANGDAARAEREDLQEGE